MEVKKPEVNLFFRLFCLFLLLIFALFFTDYMVRELWFDEALTLINFASLPSAADIYNSYTIPNNQIVHTWFMHWFISWEIPVESLRLFPLICGGLIIFLLWRNFSRELGRMPLAIALGALAISPPFMLYASALRGYMLAALFSVCALCSAKRYLLGGKMRFLALWFVISIFTVGVMPSALAGIAAAGLYAVPYGGKKFLRNRRVWLLALSAVIGFAVFYLPIADKLQKAFALKEGWQNGFAALLAVGAAAAVTFIIPLIGGAFFHRPRKRDWPRSVIWFLPLGTLFFPVAPFPRVWWLIFPVLALLCAGYLRRMPMKYLRISAVGVLIAGAVTCTGFFREMLSPAVSLGGQDDFYAPRFISEDFVPSDTAVFISRNFPGTVPFVSFDADPWAVMSYYGEVIFDGPRGRVPYLPSGIPVVLTAEEEPAVYEKRFGGRMYEVYRNNLHRVFIFRFVPGIG